MKGKDKDKDTGNDNDEEDNDDDEGNVVNVEGKVYDEGNFNVAEGKVNDEGNDNNNEVVEFSGTVRVGQTGCGVRHDHDEKLSSSSSDVSEILEHGARSSVSVKKKKRSFLSHQNDQEDEVVKQTRRR